MSRHISVVPVTGETLIQFTNFADLVNDNLVI